MRCRNCGSELQEGAKFCLTCGTPVEQQPAEPPREQEPLPVQESVPVPEAIPVQEPAPVQAPAGEAANPVTPPAGKTCQFCGGWNEADAVFCAVCGRDLRSGAAAPAPAEEAAPEQPRKTKKKFPLGLVIGAVAAVAVIAVVAVLLLGGGKSGKNGTLVPYVRDGKIYQVDLAHPSKDPVEYEEGKVDPEESTIYSSMLQYSEDFKYVAFPASINPDGTYRLYTQKVGSKDDAVRISSSVSEYVLLNDGHILYKDDDENLYLADQKGESERIDKEIRSFYVDESQKNIIWTRRNDDGDYNYIYEMYTRPVSLKTEKVRIAKDYDYYLRNTDWTTVAFFADGDLYVSRNLAEAERIDKKVTDLGAVLDNGTIYYSKELADDLSLYDLIEDDLLRSDESTLESYPSYYDFYDEGTGEYDEDAYEKAVDQYEAASDRRWLREYLKEEMLSEYGGELYRCDAKGNIELIEPAATECYEVFDNVISYSIASVEEGQITMSDFYKAYNEEDRGMQDALLGDSYRSLLFNPDGKTGFYAIRNEDGELELYSYAISDGPDSGTLLGTDVVDVVGLVGEDIYYFLEDRNEDGTLYKNGDKVADDVYISDYAYATEDGVYFMVDWDNKDECGTLTYYDGKKTAKVADDVSGSFLKITDTGVFFVTDLDSDKRNFTLNYFNKSKKTTVEISDDTSLYLALDANHVAVLRDFSTRRNEGELAWFNGKKLETLDKDVTYIFSGTGYRYSY